MPIHEKNLLNTSRAITITNTTTDNTISVDQNGAVGDDPSTDGAVHIENTGNTGIGLSVYTNIGANMNAPLAYIYSASTSNDQQALYVRDRGVGGALFVNQDGAAPAIVIDQSANSTHMRLIGDPANSSSVDGDLWFDGTNLKMNIAGTVKTIDMTDV